MHDYATYKQTFLAYAFVAPLLMLGLPQALYYFLPGEKQRARGVLFDNLLLLSAMGAIFSLFLLFGGNRLLAWRFNNPDLEHTLLLFAPYPLFMLPVAALAACLMARDRPKQVAGFEVINRLAILALVLAASLIWRTPTAAIIATVVGAGVMFLPAMGLMLRSTREGLARPSPLGMLAQMKFAVPLGLAGMAGALYMSLDKLVVSSMCQPEEFAMYANGAFEIPLVGVVTGSVTAVLLPELRRLYKEENPEQALILWKRAAKKCAMILYPFMCLLFFMAPEVITVLFSDRYTGSSIPFRFYLAMLPIQIVRFGAMIMAAGKSHLILVQSVVSLAVNLILSILLVYLLGYIGAVIATLITLYFWMVPFYTVVIAKQYNASPTNLYPYMDLMKVLAASVISCIVLVPNFFMPFLPSVVRLAILTPFYAGGILLLYAMFGLIDLRAVVASMRSRMR